MARAYLALLDLGTAEARDVCKLARIPTSKVYGTLDSLSERGLVTVLPETPRKFAPIPFAEFLDRLLQGYESAAQQIQSSREELIEYFSIVGNVELNDAGNFMVLRGRRNILDRVEQTIETAERSIFFLGTRGTLGHLQHYTKALEAARSRGVSIRFQVPVERETVDAAGALSSFGEVRSRDVATADGSSNVAMVIQDEGLAILVTLVPDDANLARGRDVAVVTDQHATVSALAALMEPGWATATSYAVRRQELETGRVREFMRVYTTQAEAYGAMHAAFAAGMKELLVVQSIPAEPLTPAGIDIGERIGAAGAFCRSILNFDRAETVPFFREVLARQPWSEIRHLDPQVFSRFSIIDDREAFFSVTRPQAVSAWGAGGAPERAEDLVIHTNNPATVASLRLHFEELWARATPLAEREREIARFPGLKPGDLGLGVLLERMRDAVVVTDAAGRILLWNPAATAMFGYAVHDVLGLTLDALGIDVAALQSDAPADAPAEAGLLPDDMGSHCPVLSARRKDGTPVDVEVTLSAIDSGDPVGPRRLAILRDVTRRRLAEVRLRESEERHRLLTEMAMDMITLSGPEGGLRYVSPASRRLLGYTPEEMVALNGSEIVHPEDLQTLSRFYAGLAGYPAATKILCRVRHKDGHYVWIESKTHAIRNLETREVEEVVSVAREAPGATAASATLIPDGSA